MWRRPFALAAIRYVSCATRHFPKFARAAAAGWLWEAASSDALQKIPSQNLRGMMGQGQTFGLMDDALSVTISKTLTTAAPLKVGASICNMHNMLLSLVSVTTCAPYICIA